MGFELNKYQKEAVEHMEGPCLVTSCPGSGKTAVLTERVVNLVRKGVRPKNILCLTFTNKASKEMKERVCKKLGVDKLGFFVGTFHSFCAKIIRKLGPGRGYDANFNIMDDKDQLDLVMQIARKLGTNIEKGEGYKIINRLNFYRDQMEDFEWVEDSLRSRPLIEIAEKYLEYCSKNNLLDFSGLIYEAIKLIEKDEVLKNKVTETFKYILVDEGQDTNKSQFYLVNLLAEKWENIMLIADLDQSIYGWRGARFQNVQDFVDKYENCKVVSLSKNYRSTPQIVSVASKLIKYNSSHMGTVFETDNKDGQPVRCNSFENQYSEASYVGRTIKRLIDEGGWKPHDIAVLYRANRQSENIESALVKNGVPYEILGAWNFFDRREIRDCLAMLKLLANPRDGIAFSRVGSLMKGLGNITIGKIENISQEKDITIPQACKVMADQAKSVSITRACEKLHSIYSNKWDQSNPSACLKGLVNKFNYDKYMIDKFGDTATEREDNVSQLALSASECNGEQDGVSKYLQQISLITNVDKDEKAKKDKVSLMTIHSSKGLEFPVVFLISVEENLLPHNMAMSQDVDGEQSERRLCYVALSRAKQCLFVSWCKKRKRFGKHGNVTFNKCKPSRFLYEAGLIEE